MTGLIVLALALSAYLSWHYLVGGSVIGCGEGNSCDQVLNSRWSTIGGVLPVSSLAAGVYMAMLVASFFIGPATAAPVRKLAWGAILILVGSAAGSAMWFTILQKWVIGAFCPYCMAAHITGLLLAILVIWRVPMQFDNNSNDVVLMNPEPVQDASLSVPRHVIGFLHAIGLTLVGMTLAGVMAACQVVITGPAIYIGGRSQDNLPVIDPHAVPLVGSSDAPYIVNMLFDYKCPHCQQMHFMLNEVIRRYDGKLAFALCPSPLDKKCNPYIYRDVDEYKDSCELAKIGLAVWLANRDAFPDFEDWMFTFESGDRWYPRSLDTARAKAVELVGQAKFDVARADPWIDRYMATCVQIYSRTIQSGTGGVPKLVFGSRWVIPEPYNTDDFIMILQKSLALPSP